MTEIKSILRRLRPHLTQEIHDTKIQAYRNAYRAQHDGADPGPEQINQFLQILIIQGTVAQETDDLLDELQRKFDRASTLGLVKNTLFSVPALTVSGFMAYVCLAPDLPDFLTQRGSFALALVGITSLIVFVAIIFHTVRTIGR